MESVNSSTGEGGKVELFNGVIDAHLHVESLRFAVRVSLTAVAALPIVVIVLIAHFI